MARFSWRGVFHGTLARHEIPCATMRTSVTGKPGSYRARYEIQGRWLSAPDRFQKKADARAWLADKRKEMAFSRDLDPDGHRMTVQEWGDLHWKLLERRITTKKVRAWAWNGYIIPKWGPRELGSIRTLDVAMWIAELRDETELSAASIRNIYYAFRNLMEGAVEVGHKIPKNPCPKKPELARVWPRAVVPLTHDQIEALAKAVPSRWSTAIYVFAYGGLRISEVAALREDDFDFDRGTLRVDEKVVDPDGVLIYQPFLKTDRGRRTIAMPWSVMEKVAAHLMTYHPERRPRQLVFTGPHGGAMRPRGWPEYVLAPAVARLDLDDFSPHSFRHTAVSMWVSMGATIKQVAERAGCSVSTIERVYAHLFPGDEERLRDAMDSALRSREELPAAVGGNVVPLRPRGR